MSTEPFIPSADSIQVAWVLMCQQSRVSTQPSEDELEAEFNRFIAKIKADALREAADAISLVIIPGSDEDDDCATAAAQGWLTGRANRIEEKS